MQVILDSSFARPGSSPIWGGKIGEFRDWTNEDYASTKNRAGPGTETNSFVTSLA